MIDQGMLGDIKWEATFSNYKDFGGVKFPTSIVQRQGGPKILEMTVADVKVNQPVDLTPPAGRGGKGGPGGGGARAVRKGGDGKGAPPEFAGGDGKGKGGPGGEGGLAVDAALLPRQSRAKISAADSGWSRAATAPWSRTSKTTSS